MHIGFHHYLKRKKIEGRLETKRNNAKKIMDNFIYIVTPLTVIIFIPQLLKIWMGKSAVGLSLLSWVGMLAGSLFWLVYGIIHKEKPMVFINIAVGMVQVLIVIGILMYH